MRKLVKALNIINIISLMPILVLIIVHTPLAIYPDTYTIIFRIILIFIGISAFVSAIIELKNKNKLTGIINIIITVITVLASIMINYFGTFMALVMVVILLALAIANLILQCKKSNDKLNSMFISIIVIFTIIEMICISMPLFYIYKDIKNLENALPKLHEQKNLTTSVYEKAGKYIFLDNKGNKIAEKDFDDLLTLAYENGYTYNLKIDNDIANLGTAKKGNKTVMINSEGEEIFEIYNLFEKKFPEMEFMNYIFATNKFGIELYSPSPDGYYDLTSKNVLSKYTGDLNSFEEDENLEYMYFKNDKIMDKILQVVINPNEIESDIKLATSYLELDFNENLHRDTSKIREFYKNKKEYYLLDVENNTKTKLECNNLIYEAYYDENEELCENILLYSNGTIPFYDTEESGYFEKDGEKKTIKSSYLLLDITDKYYIFIEREKEDGETYFMSIETGDIEKTIEETTMVFNNFYVRNYYEDGRNKYEFLDENLNEIVTTYYFSFNGNNFLVISGDGADEDKDYIYYYDNNDITLLETLESNENYAAINSIASHNNEIKENGNNIYYKVGILSYYDDLGLEE